MRRMRATALVLATALGGLVAAAPGTATARSGGPPTAADSQILVTQPVTWVDSGYQYVASWFIGDPGTSIGVTRTPNDGWDPSGRRIVTLTPPATGLRMDHVLAAGDAGVLTTVWRPATCTTSPCDRWFARFDATGASVGTPTQVLQVAQPWIALGDGSLLTVGADGAIGWRGPDGTDRGAPAMPGVGVRSAAVDTAGRLLLTDAAGTLTRWPPGGPADLTLPLGCATGQRSAAGPAPDGGFATACQAGSPLQLVVTRYTAAGTQTWQSVGTARLGSPCCRTPLALDPGRVVVDGLDRVWVAGSMSSQDGPGAAIESFTATGPGPIADARFDQMHGPTHHYADVRATTGDQVAFAAVESCCVSLEMPVSTSQVVSNGIVPLPPAVPFCNAGLQLGAIDEASVSGTVLPCDHPAIGREPTGYRVTATDAGGTVLATEDLGPGDDTTWEPFTLPLAAGGQLVQLDVTAFNGLGSGPADAQTSTIPPFATVDAFVGRQYVDLTTEGSPGQNLIVSLNLGTVTPRSVVTNLLGGGYAKADVEPVARLYRAFFLRDADPSGLSFWVLRHRSGWSLSRIAGEFAASGEFRRRYGSLTDAGFVSQLYQNVFGRPADPSGAAFWTKRLQTKRATRGQVVLGFSESTESVRRSAPTVQPLAAAFLLLRRLPTASERAAWASAPDPRAAAVADILGSADYADRIAAIG